MFPTPYPELNQVLCELVARIQLILDSNFIGAYLQGSFAVGDYDQHSDVDFIVAIREELSMPQVEALQVMHDQVYELDSEWAKHLEGSYFPREILRHPDRRGEQLWYLDHGARSLIRSDHCNTLIVRWVVREQGITLAGPPPKTLVEQIPADLLRAEIFATLNNWGQEILADPAQYNNRFYQSFIVLSYCRMLHDLQRGYPGSKRAGAEWAKSALDPAWEALIDDTWEGRPDPACKVRQPADPEAFEKTLRFVEYIINESRLYFSKQGSA
ncbi:MAG TPA: aminoglycoside adenylyltransferase domain-containing protein [Anaerolineales bacterium]|nr:aminoglycoside adenylyltransferase domain-containing protein [Anaerolineales bacterium]